MNLAGQMCRNGHYGMKSPKKLRSPRVPRKADRRIQRTKQSLHDALIALILEKGYDAITIQDIVDKANVGRSTFYAHHSGKEGLLLSGLRNLRELLLHHQRLVFAADEKSDGRILGFSRALFEHVYEHRNLYHAIVGRHSGAVIVNRMRGLLVELVGHELHASKTKAGAAALPRSAVIHFVADSIVSMLTWWLDKNAKLSPDEADLIFRRSTLPSIISAGY